MGFHHVSLTYRVIILTKKGDDDLDEHDYAITFTIDPATDKIIDLKRKEIAVQADN
jgi:hypothetical protein